jgi:phosphoribulokinase
MIQADVWVDGDSDERYYVHSVKEAAQWKSVPLVFTVELRPAPFSDIIYQIPMIL